ncbi:DUF2934 domain-containing protein [Methylomonas sp. AM2-LC]|uniref:DUF2934 domain-containing protein n=1 Tax=Methylomonas sp. AM2-LC TaxID=3153301 RepID=UPI0032652703
MSETYSLPIAESAHFKAEARRFSPGHKVDDWLSAEMEYRVYAVGNAHLSAWQHHPVQLANPIPQVPMLTVNQNKTG